jgi:hypothetical protein
MVLIIGLMVVLAFFFTLAWALREPKSVPVEAADTGSGRRARITLAAVIAAVGAASIGYRLLVRHHLEQTSALFIGIPMLLAMVVVLFARPRSSTGLIVKAVTVALLVSGVFLGEGFICIIMASPLFYAVAIIIGTGIDKMRKSRSRTEPTIMGLIVLALLPMSFEGTVARFSFNRDEVITTERLVHAMPAEVRNAVAAEPSFHRTLPPYLRMGFPRPVGTRGEGLKPGDRRVIHFAGGEGKPGDLIAEVVDAGESSATFRLVSDTSHVAHWLQWQTAEVQWSKEASGVTRVRWTLRYKRLLDPAWYFRPWERYAVKLAADYLIQTVATPSH